MVDTLVSRCGSPIDQRELVGGLHLHQSFAPWLDEVPTGTEHSARRFALLQQQVHGARLDPERRDEQREPGAEQQRSDYTDERPDPRKNLRDSAPA